MFPGPQNPERGHKERRNDRSPKPELGCKIRNVGTKNPERGYIRQNHLLQNPLLFSFDLLTFLNMETRKSHRLWVPMRSGSGPYQVWEQGFGKDGRGAMAEGQATSAADSSNEAMCISNWVHA